MATQHGIPGEWARVRGTVLSLWPLFIAFALMGAFAAALVLGRGVPAAALLFFLSVAGVAAFWRRGIRRVQSFFIGARGEERVAGLLALLPADYHVFNDFVAGRVTVDHVVVGPAGVFAVETKNWRGRVTVEGGHVLVNGRLPDRSPVRQALVQADAVGKALAGLSYAGSVTPVVCFASDTFSERLATVGPTLVINATDVADWLVRQPQTLPANACTRLVQLMETMGSNR